MAAFINLPYSQQLTAVGGTAPYVFSLKSGSLPAGLSMDATGLITGTPTVLGTSNFTVQAVDGFNGYGERAYALEIIGGNEWADEITANGFTAYWKLDEASGDYLDDIGSADMVITAGASNGTHRQAPGLVRRGPPRSYGWSNSGSGGGFANATTGLPVALGHLTGTMTCMIRAMRGGSSDPQVPMAYAWSNNSALFHGFNVFLNGQVEYTCERAGSEFNLARSAVGVIEQNKPYVLHGVQRADGTGMHIFVNGVDVTLTTSAGGTTLGLDAYVDDIMQPIVGEPTDFTIGAVIDPGFNLFSGWISEPAYARNVALSDADVLAMFNASGPALPPSDYHEVVADLILPGGPLDISGNVIGYWCTGMHTQSQNDNPSFFSRGSNYISTNSFDVPDLNIAVPSIEFPGSAYPRFKFSYDAGAASPSMNNASGNNLSQSATTATMHLIIEITEATISQIYNFLAFGSGFGANERQIQLSMVGSALGGNMRLEVKSEDIGALYQLVYVANIAIGDIVQFNVVQDGVAVQMYFNGVNITSSSTPTSAGGFSAASWANDINFIGASLAVGGIAGSTTVNNPNPNEIHEWFWTPQVLTDAQILQIYNGFQGSF